MFLINQIMLRFILYKTPHYNYIRLYNPGGTLGRQGFTDQYIHIHPTLLSYTQTHTYIHKDKDKFISTKTKT